MRNRAQFIRSHDRPLPSSILWLGAIAVCVDGEIVWSSIAFHGAASEDPERAGFATSEVYALKNKVPLTPKAPVHLDVGAAPPKDFMGYVVLGVWNLDELRAMRARAAKAEMSASPAGFIESAVSGFKGPTTPWLAMSQEDGKGVDRLVNARNAEHAAKLALALPGQLRGLLPLAELARYVQMLEVAVNAKSRCDGALTFVHRSAAEGEVEFQESIANHPLSGADQELVDSWLQGKPLPPVDDR